MASYTLPSEAPGGTPRVVNITPATILSEILARPADDPSRDADLNGFLDTRDSDGLYGGDSYKFREYLAGRRTYQVPMDKDVGAVKFGSTYPLFVRQFQTNAPNTLESLEASGDSRRLASVLWANDPTGLKFSTMVNALRTKQRDNAVAASGKTPAPLLISDADPSMKSLINDDITSQLLKEGKIEAAVLHAGVIMYKSASMNLDRTAQNAFDALEQLTGREVNSFADYRNVLEHLKETGKTEADLILALDRFVGDDVSENMSKMWPDGNGARESNTPTYKGCSFKSLHDEYKQAPKRSNEPTITGPEVAFGEGGGL
jgi:hypothetical protein